ncbi:MAG TPA: DDE-type integrase/transposase/recombinase [Edaphobacter sp.]|nr:DDE-type integrase/transposase/recombinase [Edaphobacter sp.]
MLRRLKLNRTRHIEPQLPPRRYEHAAPGDLLHLDIKRLVRIRRPSHRVTGDRRDGVKGIGAEFLHVAIDDHSRLAFTAMYPDQTERSSTHFLAAVAWFDRLGIAIQRVLTDNGPCYKANTFARSCGQLGLKGGGGCHHREHARCSAIKPLPHFKFMSQLPAFFA